MIRSRLSNVEHILKLVLDLFSKLLRYIQPAIRLASTQHSQGFVFACIGILRTDNSVYTQREPFGSQLI